MSTLKRLRRLGAGTVGTALALAIGCNSAEPEYFTGGGFAGGSSSGTSFDASPRREPSLCDEVREEESCYRESVAACERGTSANFACNARLECDQGERRWTLVPPEREDCRRDCPERFTETFEGCTGPNAGSLLCEYDEGLCGCAPVDDAGLADGGIEDDAGEVDAGPPPRYEWRCTKPTSDLDGGAGCPRLRPREGEECVREMSCDYGACVFEDGYRMRCYDGYWVRHVDRSTLCER